MFLLLCGCQCFVFLPSGSLGWSVHTTHCGNSWLLCLNCVLNCLVVVLLSVFCVSFSLLHGLICALISCRNSWLLCFIFLIVFLVLCGRQCSVFLPGGSMGSSVHTSSCGKSWMLCLNCVLNCHVVVWVSVLCVFFLVVPWVGLCTHLPVERAGCFGLCSLLCSCCRVIVTVLCFFLVVPWVGLCTLLPAERSGCIILIVFLIVFLLSCGCSLRWSVQPSPTGESWLLYFNCILNCLTAVLWLFHGLVCAHISHQKRGLVCLIAFQGDASL